MPQILKDFAFNVQAMLHWRDEFIETGEWSANKNLTDHVCRIRELLPQVLEILRDQDFDDNCG